MRASIIADRFADRLQDLTANRPGLLSLNFHAGKEPHGVEDCAGVVAGRSRQENPVTVGFGLLLATVGGADKLMGKADDLGEIIAGDAAGGKLVLQSPDAVAERHMADL